MPDAFSQRFGFRRQTPIQYRQEAPEMLRQFLRRSLLNYIYESEKRRNFAYTSMDLMPSEFTYDGENQIKMLSEQAPWYKIYDSLERLYAQLLVERSGVRYRTAEADEFRRLLNHHFETFGYAWLLAEDGHLEFRGDESFVAAMANASIALGEIGSDTAQAEIHKALEDLARRPEPDLTGAIQHAMAGLECVANQVCGTSGLELGKVVKSSPDRFPPPLGEIVPKLYGYASNNGRHITEGKEPGFAEAELIVGVAATISTYLARKK